ncbi:hypothetical protein B0H63DRAFT_523362 [Podospora didyma]|uniref:Uncharacterized protein n=1 Tax=Podospora didyma TaxID=330526 RepID=A0AAE0NQV1_9PEZI|nr:hypothetical protein B0H63DRAFT_523362 [Podospora didyma]
MGSNEVEGQASASALHREDPLRMSSDALYRPMPNAQTVHESSTDSGYLSALATGSDAQQTEKHESRAVVEEWDIETVYSDPGSTGDPDLNVYKLELVDSLVHQVTRLDASPETLERVFEVLPSLLKSLALKLGQPGSTKAQRDVIYFLYNDLAQRFKEAMLSAAKEDCLEPGQPDCVDDEVVFSRIAEWLMGLNGHTQPSEDPAHHEEQPILPEHDEALLANVAREVFLTPLAEADAMKDIRKQIIETLPQSILISRRIVSETYTLHLDMQWDLVGFLHAQDGSTQKPEEVLRKVITLIGSMSEYLILSEKNSPGWDLVRGIEVAEIAGWLGAALRPSPSTSTIANYTLRLSSEDSDGNSPEGRCWRGLFGNPVIVRGYPIAPPALL